MNKYRKKPVVIEAIQYLGLRINSDKILAFTNNIAYMKANKNPITKENDSWDCIIPTLEGAMKAVKGDFIIKGIQGEFYPCKPDIFEATYEKIEEE